MASGLVFAINGQHNDSWALCLYNEVGWLVGCV